MGDQRLVGLLSDQDILDLSLMEREIADLELELAYV